MFKSGCTRQEISTKMEPLLKALSKDIIRNRQRLGGDFAVAHAVFTRSQRNFLRNLIGSDLVFIVLNVSEDIRRKRLKNRHGDSLGDEFLDLLNRFASLEPASSNEENAFNVNISEDMSPDDVLNEAITVLRKAGLQSI